MLGTAQRVLIRTSASRMPWSNRFIVEIDQVVPLTPDRPGQD
jgi:hypothetical protein